MKAAAPLHEILGTGASSGDSATIYIVRHGATKLNNQTDTSVDRIRGWSDVPLVEEGREEARQAGEKLKGKNIEAIICSDLSRAQETAQIIGQIIGLKPAASFKLRPWNLGNLTGESTDKALPQIAQYVRASPDTPVPEGESFNQFKARGFEGFAEAVAQHQGQIILVVTHHRLERLIEAWQAKGQPPDHAIDLDVFLEKGDPPGGIKILRTSEAALKGSGMYQNDKPIGGMDNPALGPSDRFKEKWAQTGKMPAPQEAGMPGPTVGPSAGNATAMAHGRAIAGAKALHAVGHISARERDKHVSASQKMLGKGKASKPFGSFAP